MPCLLLQESFKVVDCPVCGPPSWLATHSVGYPLYGVPGLWSACSVGCLVCWVLSLRAAQSVGYPGLCGPWPESFMAA